MKLALILSLAALPAAAQLGPMASPAAAVKSGTRPSTTTGATGATTPLATIGTLEKEMDQRISATGGVQPCNLLGATRGVYVSGMGAVFTAEVELVTTPGGIGIFTQTINPVQKAKIHKDKLDRVPMLEQTMRDMALSLAASPVLKMGDSDKVVVAVRLVYRSWEDMTGLPGEIMVRIDHRGAAPTLEVQ